MTITQSLVEVFGRRESPNIDIFKERCDAWEEPTCPLTESKFDAVLTECKLKNGVWSYDGGIVAQVKYVDVCISDVLFSNVLMLEKGIWSGFDLNTRKFRGLFGLNNGLIFLDNKYFVTRYEMGDTGGYYGWAAARYAVVKASFNRFHE